MKVSGIKLPLKVLGVSLSVLTAIGCSPVQTEDMTG